jgi:hypothetical protein
MRYGFAAASIILLLSACGASRDERAATGVGTGVIAGAIVGGPIGAVVGGAIGGAGASTLDEGVDQKAGRAF